MNKPSTPPPSVGLPAPLKDTLTIVIGSGLTRAIGRQVIRLDQHLSAADRAFGRGALSATDYTQIQGSAMSLVANVEALVERLRTYKAVQEEANRAKKRPHRPGRRPAVQSAPSPSASPAAGPAATPGATAPTQSAPARSPKAAKPGKQPAGKTPPATSSTPTRNPATSTPDPDETIPVASSDVGALKLDA